MTHGRKPRKPRAADPFAFGTALTKAARLTPGEVATIVRASGRKWVVSLLDPWPFPGTEAKVMELTVDYTELGVVG